MATFSFCAPANVISGLALSAVLASGAFGQVVSAGQTVNLGGAVGDGDKIVPVAAQLSVLGGIYNSENGSFFGNQGTVLVTGGGIFNSYNDYLDQSNTLQPTTVANPTQFYNVAGATVALGDASGAGLMVNGYSDQAAPINPSLVQVFPAGGGYFSNLGGDINVQNGSHLDNVGTGATMENSAGGIINIYSGYFDSTGNYQSNTTGAVSILKNEVGSVLNNGDLNGAALIMNGGYSLVPTFTPGLLVQATFDGAQLYNAGSIINNQNGSHLDNYGTGTLLTNTGGAIINNLSGSIDANLNYSSNNTGETSEIRNELGAVIQNGDGIGAGLIMNGGYSLVPTFSPGLLVQTTFDGALLYNSGSIINNQNGSHLDNYGTGTLLTNTGGAIINNLSGSIDTNFNYSSNTTGWTSTIRNELGAVIQNGDGTGAGLIMNGGYSLVSTFSPGLLVQTTFDGALLYNSGSIINNQNGSHLDNYGTGTLLTNTGGAIINNLSGSIDTNFNYSANTTGWTSTIRNELGAVIQNGDGTGAGLIMNGGYSLVPTFTPGLLVQTTFDGALLYNSGSIINNQNGSHLDNYGTGTLLTNTGGAIINNLSGSIDTNFNYSANTTGWTSTIRNELGAVIQNGDGTGAGLIMNGGYSLVSTFSPGLLVQTTFDGALLYNSGSIINNQNGSHLDNYGTGTLLTNTGGAIINNLSGSIDTNFNYSSNTTGWTSTIRNELGAVIQNGDGTGAGLIMNGGYSLVSTFSPGLLVQTTFDGALLYNSGSIINNQNGSHLDNYGTGTLLTNTGGAIINNLSGSIDTNFNYSANTTGWTSTIRNELGAVIQNGDGTGAGLIMNGGYSLVPTFTPGLLVQTTFDGALLYNSGSIINNQNGSHLDNYGTGTLLTNTGGAIINNLSGSIDTNFNYSSNTTGWTSTIRNELGAVIQNGDGTGAGLIMNGGYSLVSTFSPGLLVQTTFDGALLYNSGSIINNQNGSHLDNYGTGTLLTNTGGAIINNLSGSIDTNFNYSANTTGWTSTIRNELGAVIQNGDGTGAGLIMNGGYSLVPTFTPGLLVQTTFDGALLYNSGSIINNQNGSHLDNYGTGTLLTNTGGAIINNLSGSIDTNFNYSANTTGWTSTIRNELGAVIQNGDGTGAGLIMNGGYSLVPTFTPGLLVQTTSDGALLYNSSSVINNQNGSHLDNYGTGTVLTNTAGAIINNLNGYFGSGNNVLANNTGWTSEFRNELGAVINNGDSAGNGTINNLGGALLYNAATINNQAGSVINNLGATSTVTNDVGGVITNDGQITSGGVFQDAGSVLGAGTFTQTGGKTTVTGVLAQNTVNVQGGAFTIASEGAAHVSTFNQSGGTTLVDGALDPLAISVTGGEFGGTGLVEGDLSNSGGQVLLGDSLTAPGTFSEIGNYDQGSGGELIVSIESATDNGLFSIDGGATLDGTLDIDLLAGFAPLRHETFTIMTFTGGTETGAFSSIVGSDAGEWTVLYNGTNVELVSNVPESASTLMLGALGLAALAAATRGKLRTIPSAWSGQDSCR